MQLGAFPDDVDFAKYENLCDEMLFDLGVKVLKKSLFDLKKLICFTKPERNKGYCDSSCSSKSMSKLDISARYR